MIGLDADFRRCRESRAAGSSACAAQSASAASRRRRGGRSAAGREVVGGRARRGRDDQAVGAHLHHALTADRDRELDDARQRRLGDHDVVEHQAIGEDLRRRASSARAASCGLDARRRRRGRPRATRRAPASVISVRNPRLPKLTPRIGTSHAGVRDPAGHPDERAVAAEHDDQIARLRQLVARRRRRVPAAGRRARPSRSRRPARRRALRASPRAPRARRRRRRGRAWRRDPTRRVIGVRHSRRGVVRCSRNSRLPSVPVIGDSVSPDARQS